MVVGVKLERLFLAESANQLKVVLPLRPPDPLEQPAVAFGNVRARQAGFPQSAPSFDMGARIASGRDEILGIRLFTVAGLAQPEAVFFLAIPAERERLNVVNFLNHFGLTIGADMAAPSALDAVREVSPERNAANRASHCNSPSGLEPDHSRPVDIKILRPIAF